MPNKEPAKISRPSKYLKWGVERRMEFIEFRLYWEGKINRRDLIEQFGVSMPQASADFNRYQEMAPGNLVYDTRAKHYYPSDKFNLRFLNPDSDRYLANLMSLSSGILTAEESWLAAIPAYDVLPQPRRAIDPERLRRVVAAIREGVALQVCYQSMNTPEPEWRWITPHALAFDGYRWHVRAFCHKAESFKDFVMARIVSIRGTKEHDLNPEADREWHEIIDVRVGPHPDLTECQCKAIELDYGMDDGEMVISVRRGFLFYFLKRLGLDLAPNVRQPRHQQIVLLNRDEVYAALPMRARLSNRLMSDPENVPSC
ncbi:MAG: WYL domain-containing protein [Magnetococcales bacterium]|nr:WYL domain-containing protein [Magnetococcales bacterium]